MPHSHSHSLLKRSIRLRLEFNIGQQHQKVTTPIWQTPAYAEGAHYTRTALALLNLAFASASREAKVCTSGSPVSRNQSGEARTNTSIAASACRPFSERAFFNRMEIPRLRARARVKLRDRASVQLRRRLQLATCWLLSSSWAHPLLLRATQTGQGEARAPSSAAQTDIARERRCQDWRLTKLALAAAVGLHSQELFASKRDRHCTRTVQSRWTVFRADSLAAVQVHADLRPPPFVRSKQSSLFICVSDKRAGVCRWIVRGRLLCLVIK